MTIRIDTSGITDHDYNDEGSKWSHDLYLDPQGYVTVECGETRTTPMDVHGGYRIWIGRIPNGTYDAAPVVDVLESGEVRALLETVHGGHTEGDYGRTGKLTDEASDALSELVQVLQGAIDDAELERYWTADEYLYGGDHPTFETVEAAHSLNREEAIVDLLEGAEYEGAHLEREDVSSVLAGIKGEYCPCCGAPQRGCEVAAALLAACDEGGTVPAEAMVELTSDQQLHAAMPLEYAAQKLGCALSLVRQQD